MLHGKRILLIISGGIAAYKCLDLIRRLRERGASVRCVLTDAATQFVTPLSVSALSEDRVYGDLFSLTDEAEMGHIQLSRDADLLVVAPATTNIMAKMAQGIGDLWGRNNAEWEKYGFLVDNMPDDLKEKYLRIQKEAIERAKSFGWNAENDLAGDED